MTTQDIKNLLAQNMDQTSFEAAWAELQPMLEQIEKEHDMALAALHEKALAEAKDQGREDLEDIQSIDRVTALEDESISIAIDVASEIEA